MKHSSKTHFIGPDQEAKVTGIYLRGDYAREHERGIESIWRNFGINPQEGEGWDRFKAKVFPKDFVTFSEKDGKACLVFTKNEMLLNFIVSDPCWQLALDDNTKITSAWSEGSFAVLVRGEENIAYLKDFYEAIKTCDISILLTQGNAVIPSSLVLSIYSRIPNK